MRAVARFSALSRLPTRRRQQRYTAKPTALKPMKSSRFRKASNTHYIVNSGMKGAGSVQLNGWPSPQTEGKPPIQVSNFLPFHSRIYNFLASQDTFELPDAIHYPRLILPSHSVVLAT